MLELNLDTTEKIVSVITGAFAITGGLAVWWRRRSKEGQQPPVTQQSISTGGNNQTVNVSVGASVTAPIPPEGTSNGLSILDLKRTTNILFVDDDRGFKIVSVLKKMGWDHTKLVSDITFLEQPALLDAHVVFVDILQIQPVANGGRPNFRAGNSSVRLARGALASVDSSWQSTSSRGLTLPLSGRATASFACCVPPLM
jgi:hypothetical protein